MGAFFATTLGKVVIAILIALVCLAVISRNWNCKKPRDKWRDRPRCQSYTLIEVLSGCDIKVQYGVGDRKTATVKLYGIVIPQQVSGEAKTRLSIMCGKEVSISTPDRAFEAMELDARRPPPYIGIVYALDGCCQLLLIQEGLAQCTCEREDWVEAEKLAKKQKLGIWGVKR